MPMALALPPLARNRRVRHALALAGVKFAIYLLRRAPRSALFTYVERYADSLSKCRRRADDTPATTILATLRYRKRIAADYDAAMSVDIDAH